MGYKSIGKQLQLAREQAGYSQEQLAAKIGCSQSTLSNYEKGKRRVYLAQLALIAEILGKPIEFFLRSADFHTPGQHNLPGDKLYDLYANDLKQKLPVFPGTGSAGSSEEQNLLAAYASLSPEGQRLVIDFITWLKKKEALGNG
ncbi:helix-turn-helix domain-containing protein [Desulfoscipio sp. XC116]|uniref:helix-turn-helix domain-containing protein n=1 Tax=Desulfoscipio sp. XC116 TaxID=3144975 RepID=UPI00325BBEDB